MGDIHTNHIERDLDHFKIVATEQFKSTHTSLPAYVSISHPAKPIESRSARLIRESPSSLKFVSPPLLLLADTIDANSTIPTHETISQKFLTSLGAEVEVRIQTNATASIHLQAGLPVRQKVNITSVIPVVGGEPVVEESYVMEDFQRANAIFAQTQIQLVMESIETMIVSNGDILNLSNGLDVDGADSQIHPEQESLLNLYGITNDVNDIRVIYVDQFNTSLDNYQGSAFIRDGGSNLGNNIVLSRKGSKGFLLSHEIMHLLINEGNSAHKPETWKIMTSKLKTLNNVYDSKRITQEETLQIRGAL